MAFNTKRACVLGFCLQNMHETDQKAEISQSFAVDLSVYFFFLCRLVTVTRTLIVGYEPNLFPPVSIEALS